MRPRNAMLGQFDHLYTCELIYYAQDRDAVYITREITPIQPRTRFRRDWRASVAASYIGDLAARVAPHHEPTPELFHLLDQALNELEQRGWHAPSLFLFEIRLLDLLGFAPKLNGCASCNQPFKSGHSARFSSRRGGMICDACHEPSETYAIGADVLAMLKFWQSADEWSAARTARCTPRQLETVRHLLGDFLVYHLELKPGIRRETLRLLME